MLTWRPHLPKKVATKSPGFNIIEEYTIDELNASVGNKKGNNSPAVKLKSAGNVGTIAADHTDIPETVNHAGVVSSAVHMETGAPIKGESPDDVNCVKNIPPTGTMETSAAEHHSVQEIGIPIKNTVHADDVKTQTEYGDSVLPDNQPSSALHVVTKTEESVPLMSGHNKSTEKLPNTVDQCIPEQDLHVETGETCPEDGTLLCQFPCKQ